jgi:hypothetical protein
MTAQTPWGILIAGKRPFSFGIGAQYDGSQASSESFGVVAPYGPFRIGMVIYPWRGQTWVNSGNGPQIISTVTAAPFNNGAQPAVINYRVWDNEAKRQLQPGVFFTYDNGPLSLGAVYEWFSIHNSPMGARTLVGANTVARTSDETLEDGSAFIKYNNGRFFANMELAWVRGQTTSQRGMTEVPVSYNGGYGAIYASDGVSAAPGYNETWKWMMEIGALCGPAKISALWSWVPGPDRRGGVWIDRQSWENVANGSFLANPRAFLPYSLLMAYQYGAGLNALSRSGEGYMTDANSYGARLDYAVAANLNMYVSGFYADRVSGGWPLGIMTLTSRQAVGLEGGGQALLLGQGFGNFAVQNLGGNASAPNIPDNSLGWEVTAGVDWKLLEGFKTTLRGAYWQPGKWFSYACVDRTYANVVAANTIVPTAGEGPVGSNGWTVNPSRNIDPIFMFQGTMQVDF